MPEGPEVKISSELIKPLVIGKKVADVAVGNKSRYKENNPDGFDDFQESLFHSDVVVTDIRVKGKFMYWIFSNGWYLMNTFGMSGQWSAVDGHHPCFFVEFADTTQMVFNDPRHFGTIKLTNRVEELNTKLNELGWDPLSEDWSKWSNYISTQISKSTKPIGELLMNQKLFAGVGNYIRAEALYASKLSPWRKGNNLSITEINSLAEALVKVMKESYDHQGATIHTYKDAYGEEGKYSSCFKVYGQKIDPLGHKIIKEETPEGRTIHWCPDMQV